MSLLESEAHVDERALANLIAIPLCNLVVMLAALVTLMTMPLGLEALPLWIMGLGIEGMTCITAFVRAHSVA